MGSKSKLLGFKAIIDAKDVFCGRDVVILNGKNKKDLFLRLVMNFNNYKLKSLSTIKEDCVKTIKSTKCFLEGDQTDVSPNCADFILKGLKSGVISELYDSVDLESPSVLFVSSQKSKNDTLNTEIDGYVKEIVFIESKGEYSSYIAN